MQTAGDSLLLIGATLGKVVHDINRRAFSILQASNFTWERIAAHRCSLFCKGLGPQGLFTPLVCHVVSVVFRMRNRGTKMIREALKVPNFKPFLMLARKGQDVKRVQQLHQQQRLLRIQCLGQIDTGDSAPHPLLIHQAR